MQLPSYNQGLQLDRAWVELKAKLDHAAAQRLIGSFDSIYQIAMGKISRKEISALVTFSQDMRKKGWALLEDTPQRITSARLLELVPFLKGEESSTSVKELIERAKELNANYGQRDAEYFLDHQEEIPKEFRDFKLVFTATLWESSDKRQHMPHLYWHGGRDGQWGMGFDDTFYNTSRLICVL